MLAGLMLAMTASGQYVTLTPTNAGPNLVTFTITTNGPSYFTVTNISIVSWTPQTASQSVYQFWDAQTLSGSDGDPVSTWAATSGGHSLTAGTAAKLAASNLGGHNVLIFTNTADLYDGSFTLNQPFTVALTYKLDALEDNTAIWSQNGGTYNNLSLASSRLVIAEAGSNQSFTNADISWHTLIISCNAGSSWFSIDGGSAVAISGSIGTGNMTALDVGGFGASQNAQVHIGDIMFFSGSLNQTTDVAGFSTFETSRWGVSFPH